MGLKIISTRKNPRIRKKLRRGKLRKKKFVTAKPRKRRRRIIRVRKNMTRPRLPRHETMIVGFLRGSGGKIGGTRVYFTGTGFSRKRQDTKIFPGDGAKSEAKRILPILPRQLYGIQVQTT